MKESGEYHSKGLDEDQGIFQALYLTIKQLQEINEYI